MLVTGSTWAWTAPALIKLLSNDTEVNPLGKPITTLEISMLVSIPALTSVMGSLLPLTSDVMGRKKSMLYMTLGSFLSQIGLAFSTNIPAMIICSSVFGIFISGQLIILQIYITEICEDHNRAKYGCIMSFFLPIGELYTYILGPLFSFKYFTLLVNLPFIFFLLFVFAPESPMFLLSKGRKEECIKILKKLRSNKTNAEIDIDYYKISQSLHSGNDDTQSNFFTVFQTKEGRIGMFLAIFPILGQCFSGVPIIMLIIAPIFDEAGTSLSGEHFAIIAGIFKVCVSTITSLLVEKTGRRPMLLLSSAGSGIAISFLGIFFYLKHINSPLVIYIQWLPLVSLLFYFFFFALGLGPLPSAVMGELFPTDIRSSATSIISSISCVIFAGYMFLFPLFADLVGLYWVMWTFGISCLGTTLLVYVFLPEIKGKSIHEIQELLKNY